MPEKAGGGKKKIAVHVKIVQGFPKFYTAFVCVCVCWRKSVNGRIYGGKLESCRR